MACLPIMINFSMVSLSVIYGLVHRNASRFDKYFRTPTIIFLWAKSWHGYQSSKVIKVAAAHLSVGGNGNSVVIEIKRIVIIFREVNPQLLIGVLVTESVRYKSHSEFYRGYISPGKQN